MKKTFVGAVAALLFMFCFSLHPVSAQAAEHTLQLENDDWVCYTDGQRDDSYTGMAVNEYGWWYLTDGEIDWDFTGMACNEYGWWYMHNGALDLSYTGIADVNGEPWYAVNGTIDFNEDGMVAANGSWWYLFRSKVDTNFTGLALNEYGWWYINAGEIDLSYTGLGLNEYGWWYVNNGAVDLSYTGMAPLNYDWWYVTNGALDRDFTGMAVYAGGWYYLIDGYLDRSYEGLASNEYGWWYVSNGTIDFTYNGMAANEYGWWYFTDGYLDSYFNGIGENEYGYWYYRNGRIDFGYSGKANYQKKTYQVTNGAATLISHSENYDSSIRDTASTDYAEKYDLSAFDTAMVSQTQVYSRLQKLGLNLSELTNPSAAKNAAESAIDSALSSLPTEKVYYNGTTVGILASGGLNDFLLANQGKIVVLNQDLYVNGQYDTIMIPSNTVLDGNGHTIYQKAGGTTPDIAVSFYYFTEYVNQHISSNAGLRNLNTAVAYQVDVNLWGADKVLVENCNFANSTGNSIVVKNNNGDTSQYVKIAGNTISNCGGDGIAVYDDESYINVTGNTINNCAGRAGIMISCLNEGVPIRVDQEVTGPHEVICQNNTVSGLTVGEGIYCIGTYKAYVLNNKISDCYLEGVCLDYGCIGTWFYGNDISETGKLGGLPGLSIDNALYNFVDNNKIYDNTCDGIKLVRTGDATLIVNNTVYNNNKNLAGSKVSSGVDIEPLEVGADDGDRLDGFGSDGNIIMNNTIYGHSVGVYIAEDSLTGTSVDNVVKFNTISDCSYKYLVDFSSGSFNRMKESENTLK